LLNALCNFAALACADSDAVNRANRRDFGGGAREEKFVCNVKCGALNARFGDGNFEFAANLYDAVARNAGQNRRRQRRRNDAAFVNDKTFSPEPSETKPRSSSAIPSA
jgi:hypothetical protein